MPGKQEKRDSQLVDDKDILFTFLAKYGARPSPIGEDWARENWKNMQSIVDRISLLQNEAKVKFLLPGKSRTIVCSVLGASLIAAIEHHHRQRSNEEKIIESLENLVRCHQTTISKLEKELEYKEEENHLLRVALEVNRIVNTTNSQNTSSQDTVSSGSTNPIYPQKELEQMKKLDENPPNLRPLIKTEFSYPNDEETDPHITTLETPYSATKLATLKREYGHLIKESKTKYVSLTGGDQIQLSEKEAEGYWGHGVFLTTGDRRAPWSLTQRAAYWAGGLNPLDRGDPLAITGTADQLLESVHKAACLQMIHERKLIPGCELSMILSVNPEIMTALIRGLPESLKTTEASLQKTTASMSPVEQSQIFTCRGDNSRNTGSTSTDSYTNSSDFSTPAPPGNKPHPRLKVWTWVEVTQEVVDYNKKYCPVEPLEERSRGVQQVRVKNALPCPSKTMDVAKELSQPKPLSVQLDWWRLGLRKGIPRDLMDGLPLEKLCKLVTQWRVTKPPSSVKESAPVTASAPPFTEIADKTLKQTFFSRTGKLGSPFPSGGQGNGEWIYVKQLTKTEKGDVLITAIVGFYSGSFKDAEKRYTAWEKGLFVVSLAFIEVDAQIEHFCDVFSVTEEASKNLSIQETESLDINQDKPASVIWVALPFSQYQTINAWFIVPSF